MKLIKQKLASSRRFFVVAALLLGGLALSTQFSYAEPPEKQGFVLISAADFEIWDAENKDLQRPEEEDTEFYSDDKFTPVDNAPTIIVMAPGAGAEESEALLSPIDFIMEFETQGETTIDLDSIKIKYKHGFWMDVTNRILEHAVISAQGLQAMGAKIPTGKHKMRLEVKDSLGRKARVQITFRIVEEVTPVSD